MTFWQLLVGIASIAPVWAALFVGVKAGAIGVLTALVVGAGLHFAAIAGLNLMGQRVTQRIFRARSEFWQEAVTIALYLVPLCWGFGATTFSVFLMRVVTSLFVP